MNYKKCTKCGVVYPATSEFFYKDKRGRFGFYGRCKKCFNEITSKNKKSVTYKLWAKNYNKKYYTKNAERLRAYGRKKYWANREARIKIKMPMVA